MSEHFDKSTLSARSQQRTPLKGKITDLRDGQIELPHDLHIRKA